MESKPQHQIMLDENDVVESVCCHLVKNGYVIVQKRSTIQRGTDIIAKKQSSSERLHIEAKGATSSRNGSARFGKTYSPTQVFDRVAKGFYTVCKIMSSEENVGNKFALAVPDTQLFRKHIAAVKPAATRLGIGILLVSEKRAVCEF
jgi:hypothetical protein